VFGNYNTVSAETVDMKICHRYWETVPEQDKADRKQHKKINEAIQFLEFHNSSTESWTNRVKGYSFNQMRTFCRNEIECLKRVIYTNTNEVHKKISLDDKVYLGQGKWNDEGEESQMMTLICSLNTNKSDGSLTILLSLLQDKDPANVCIWKINTPQWYLPECKQQATFNKHIEKMICVDPNDNALKIDPLSSLMTFSRY
jgi:hypothetical protein